MTKVKISDLRREMIEGVFKCPKCGREISEENELLVSGIHEVWVSATLSESGVYSVSEPAVYSDDYGVHDEPEEVVVQGCNECV